MEDSHFNWESRAMATVRTQAVVVHPSKDKVNQD